MFAFFDLNPIHWIILIVIGSLLIGVPVLLVVLLIGSQGRKPD